MLTVDQLQTMHVKVGTNSWLEVQMGQIEEGDVVRITQRNGKSQIYTARSDASFQIEEGKKPELMQADLKALAEG